MWKHIKIWLFELTQTPLIVQINNLKISENERKELMRNIVDFCDTTVNSYIDAYASDTKK